jgi:hypothetical protein
MRSILVSTHDDDAVLFSCWNLLRHKPLVVTVFDGFVQGNRGLLITATQRAEETEAACKILGVQCERVGFCDDREYTPIQIREAVAAFDIGWDDGPSIPLIVPAYEIDGHHQHNLVARAFSGFPRTEYLSYTTAGKSISENEVPFEPSWIGLKLKALACFESQWEPRAGCAEHFIGRSLREYVK